MIKVLVEQAWERIVAELRADIGDKSFDVWFGKARVLSLKRGLLLIGVPNDLTRTWVEERYGSVLSRYASHALGATVRAEIVVDPEQIAVMRAQADEEAAEDVATEPTDLKPLDAFVVTAGAELAMRAIQHVASQKRPDLNPLLVHGPESTGKTHLAGGLPRACTGRVCYRVTGTEFARRFSWHLKTRRLDDFRSKILGSDVLILDDLQDLGQKEVTQRELSGLMQALIGRGGQVVAFSRAHPHEPDVIAPGLGSILTSGMVVSIDPPTAEETITILEQMLAFARRRIPRTVIALIAERMGGTVKRLDREIRKIYAFASLTGEPVTAEWLDRHGPELTRPTDPEARRVDGIITAVAEQFRVDRDRLLEKRKTRSLATPRGLVVVMLRDLAGLTFKTIGQIVGDRSHPTVYLMYQRYAPEIEQDPSLSRFVREVGRRLSGAGSA